MWSLYPLLNPIPSSSEIAQAAQQSEAVPVAITQSADLGHKFGLSSITELGTTIERSWPWTQTLVFENELWRWSLCLVTALLSVLFYRLIRYVLMAWLVQLTGKTESSLDDDLLAALKLPLSRFVIVSGCYLSLEWLQLHSVLDWSLTLAYRLFVIMTIGWGLRRMTAALTPWIQKFTSPDDHYITPLITRILLIMINILTLMLMLQEFGINVSGIIAGLGVGGLAFALAAKDTLANWFGALMIYTDRPFSIGQWIKTSQLEGVVEEIGLRSTRIRTFSKTVVSIPNRLLADEIIENFSKMPKRRISFKVGVTYDTTPAMLEESVERIRDILRDHPDVDQSFWLVKFTEFGDSALELFIYFFTDTTDWEVYLTIKQEINLQVMQRLHDLGVQFAFPSVSVYQTQINPEELSRLDAQARRLFAARRPSESVDHHVSQVAPSESNAEG